MNRRVHSKGIIEHNNLGTQEVPRLLCLVREHTTAELANDFLQYRILKTYPVINPVVSRVKLLSSIRGWDNAYTVFVCKNRKLLSKRSMQSKRFNPSMKVC